MHEEAPRSLKSHLPLRAWSHCGWFVRFVWSIWPTWLRWGRVEGIVRPAQADAEAEQNGALFLLLLCLRSFWKARPRVSKCSMGGCRWV